MIVKVCLIQLRPRLFPHKDLWIIYQNKLCIRSRIERSATPATKLQRANDAWR